MIWEITAYNGTFGVYSLPPKAAIDKFLQDFGLCMYDIKTIVNLH